MIQNESLRLTEQGDGWRTADVPTPRDVFSDVSCCRLIPAADGTESERDAASSSCYLLGSTRRPTAALAVTQRFTRRLQHLTELPRGRAVPGHAEENQPALFVLLIIQLDGVVRGPGSGVRGPQTLQTLHEMI